MRGIGKLGRQLSIYVLVVLTLAGAVAVVPPAGRAGAVDTFYDALNAVTCPNAATCFAVGYQEIGMSSFEAVPLIERWNGRHWHISPSPVVDLGGEGPGLCQLEDSNDLEYPCGTLSSVSCSGPSTCFAVGSAAWDGSQRPLVERWNGRSWSIAKLLTKFSGGSLADVSCAPGGPTCVAVGLAGNLTGSPYVDQELIMRWTGSRWKMNLSGRLRVDAVACPTPASCYAVGEGAHDVLAAHWNGHAWSIMPNPKQGISGALTAIACPSDSSCFAIGGGEPLSSNTNCLAETVVDHWNGTAWSVMPHPTVSEPCDPGFSDLSLVAAMFSVACLRPSSCFASGMGDNGPIGWQWNGSTWTARSDFGGSQTLGCGGGQCMAVGNRGICCFEGDTATAIQRWDGTRWQLLPSPNGPSTVSALDTIDCVSADVCTAAGALNHTSTAQIVAFVISGGNTHWITSTPPAATTATGTAAQVDDELQGISCVGPHDCEAVGNGDTGVIDHWNGTSWSMQRSPTLELTSVSCPAASDCMATAGDFDHPVSPMAIHWNGRSWTASLRASHGFSGSLFGVSCWNRSGCMAVGVGDSPKWGNVLFAERWNGRSWTRLPMQGPAVAGTYTQLNAVDCLSARFCLAAGYEGYSFEARPFVESWNGRKWAIVPAPGMTSARGAASGYLSGLSCLDAYTCFAAGYFDLPQERYPGGAYPQRALIERWNGTKWALVRAAEPSGSFENSQLAGVSCTHGVCYAAGSYDSPTGQFPLIERWTGGGWKVVSPPAS